MNLPLCFIMIFKRFGEKQDLFHAEIDASSAGRVLLAGLFELVLAIIG